ncbi:MAG: NTP transferase domain-containing protein [candidate division Zixibacteria bacterium]|nr:NTP transferase domain-containing protein [candidate division Zixibacteria bacterium]
MKDVYAVVLAGGKGERFWPLSRTDRPKQFLRLTSDRTMISETVDRIRPLIPLEKVVLVTGENISDKINEHVPDLPRENVLIEPFGKNTCMAIAYAAAHVYRKDPNAVMIVLSCDHLIRPAEKLLEALEAAIKVTTSGDYLVTIGIVPTRAETGYGYIQLSDIFNTVDGIDIYRINRFKEKPSRMAAQEYYYDRKHLWNSGIFIWSVESIVAAIKKYAPRIGKLMDQLIECIETPEEAAIKEDVYSQAENVSIDVAILERADNVLTIKSNFIWDDVGSWLALERFKQRDKHHNVSIGKAFQAETFETTIVNDDDDGIITTFGVSDLVIVKTKGIVMVAHKTKVPEIKDFVSRIAEDDALQEYL